MTTTNKILSAVEIFDQLNQAGIIGQVEYKKALAQFGYQHLLRIQLNKEGSSIEKCNLCVAGPSGSAKTMAIEALANIIGVDFFRVDGANICQSGYKGVKTVDSIFPDLYEACQHNVRRMENAIVFVDEFDKVIDKYQMVERNTPLGTGDNFLKLIEGQAKYLVEPGVSVDTRKIPFICAGTFGYSNFQTAAKHQCGFLHEDEDTFKLTPEHLINFGFSPEIVGRFSLLTQINVLTIEEYREIIDSPKGAVAEKVKVLDLQDVKVTITDAGKDLMARTAQESGIGARSLRQSIQQATSSSIFDIQSNPKINEVVIDDVDGKLTCVYKEGKRARKPQKIAALETKEELPLSFENYEQIVRGEDSIVQGIHEEYLHNLESLFDSPKDCDFSKFKGIIPLEQTKENVDYVLAVIKDDLEQCTPDLWVFTRTLLSTVAENEQANQPMGMLYNQSVKTFIAHLQKEVKDNEVLY